MPEVSGPTMVPVSISGTHAAPGVTIKELLAIVNREVEARLVDLDARIQTIDGGGP